jgi:hypothetical protein
VRISSHGLEAIDELTTIYGAGMDQIRKIFLLRRADIFEPGNKIVSQLERSLFDSTEPFLRPKEMKRILLTRVYQ